MSVRSPHLVLQFSILCFILTVLPFETGADDIRFQTTLGTLLLPNSLDRSGPYYQFVVQPTPAVETGLWRLQLTANGRILQSIDSLRSGISLTEYGAQLTRPGFSMTVGALSNYNAGLLGSFGPDSMQSVDYGSLLSGRIDDVTRSWHQVGLKTEWWDRVLLEVSFGIPRSNTALSHNLIGYRPALDIPERSTRPSLAGSERTLRDVDIQPTASVAAGVRDIGARTYAGLRLRGLSLGVVYYTGPRPVYDLDYTVINPNTEDIGYPIIPYVYDVRVRPIHRPVNMVGLRANVEHGVLEAGGGFHLVQQEMRIPGFLDTLVRKQLTSRYAWATGLRSHVFGRIRMDEWFIEAAINEFALISSGISPELPFLYRSAGVSLRRTTAKLRPGVQSVVALRDGSVMLVPELTVPLERALSATVRLVTFVAESGTAFGSYTDLRSVTFEAKLEL